MHGGDKKRIDELEDRLVEMILSPQGRVEYITTTTKIYVCVSEVTMREIALGWIVLKR